MTDLARHTVFAKLASVDATLRAAAAFGDGVAGALWDRNATTVTRYDSPNHHTLSLYVAGGEAIRRRLPERDVPSFGTGSLCLMPHEASSEWEVDGPIRLLHLYISRQAFARTVSETLDADPDRVNLRDLPYFRDPAIEAVMRDTMLSLDWQEPAERIAVSHAARTLLAYLACRLTERDPKALAARGGLSPAVLRRLRAFVDAHLADPLGIDALADCAGLSPFHFARAFRRSTGETPHAFVLRLRIERARQVLAAGTPPAHAASLCGFSSQSHFTARFRAQTGLTPGQFLRSR